MKTDCKWFDDVECPYASGYQECDGCDKYEPENKHPLDDTEKDCEKFHMMRDMEAEEKL